MATRSRPRRVLVGCLVVAAAPLVYLAGLNGFANFVLPGWLSRDPGRFTASWGFVWMWIPGRVSTLHALTLSGANPHGRWVVTAEHAAGTVALGPLWDRELVVTELRATGVTGRTERATGPEKRGRPWKIRVDGEVVAERIEADGVVLEGRVQGRGTLRVDATTSVDLDAEVRGARVHSAGAGVASAVDGGIHGTIDHLVPGQPLGRSNWAQLTADAWVEADIDTLQFLAPYLERAPWLSLVGSGVLRADLSLHGGELQPGSVVDAETRDLAVTFLSYEIAGDGVVHGEVVDHVGVSRTELSVRFGAYAIGDGNEQPLVIGDGFTIIGDSPHVSLAEPFDDVSLELDLPPSTIPALPRFNVFLPTDVGFSVTSGDGRVSGTLEVRTLDGLATGAAHLSGRDIGARFDDLGAVFDFRLDVPLQEGDLADHVYDFSGAALELTRLGLTDLAPGNERAPRWSQERDWWATVRVPHGRALAGRDEYLDAEITLEALDSTAFVRLVSQRMELSGWLQEALSVRDVAGTGHLVLGLGSLDLEPLSLSAGRHYEVGLRWHRRTDQNAGALFAAWRGVSAGFAFDGDARELVPFGARDWFATGEPTGEPSVEPESIRRPTFRWTRKDRDPASPPKPGRKK